MGFITKNPNGLTKDKHYSSWINGGQTKVLLSVNSEKELIEIFQKANNSGLKTTLITDAGRTVFSEPTKTVVAIGPDNSIEIDKITGHLKLYKF